MYRLFAAFLLLVACAGYSQEITNSFKYDYTTLQNSGSTSITRHFAQFNYNQYFAKSTLMYTAGTSLYTMHNSMFVSPLNGSTLEGITSIKAGVSYRFNLSGIWEGIASFTPELNTNFKGTGIKNVYPGFFAGVSKTTTGSSPSTLTMGVGYKGYFGKFMFMPIINYYKKVNEKISYNLGVPSTEFAYKLGKKHTLKSVVFADAIYTKIGGDNYVYDGLLNNNTQKINTLEMLTVNAGLEYNYLSAEDWVGTLKTGYSFYNKLTVNNTNIDFNNSLYISLGFKYNLNF